MQNLFKDKPSAVAVPKRLEQTKVFVTQPRETVQVCFEGGAGEQQVYGAPIGTSVEEFIYGAKIAEYPRVVAAFVNGTLRELTHQLITDAVLMPVTQDMTDGRRIYRRSLSFLLITAVQELFPKVRVHIDYSLTAGRLYCEVSGREPFSARDLAQIEERMKEIVAEDAPITKERVSLPKAVELFSKCGDEDKVRLIRYRRKDYLTLYTMRNTPGYFYGYMVPSARYLYDFKLESLGQGFALHFRESEMRYWRLEFIQATKLTAAFDKYGELLENIGVRNVAELNYTIETGRIREVVLAAEAFHEHHIAATAARIARQRERVQLVLIAGPSSAGKTTCMKRLAIQLLTRGIRPVMISLDDYFVPRELTPRDENGEYDFESLDALDRVLLTEQFRRLMRGEEVTLSRFDFHLGQREWGETIKLHRDQIIIAEGLHGLNPELVPDISEENVFRVYISALTQLNIDNHNRISTAETRLVRRIVRDAQFRGYSAYETIKRWQSVRRGEERFIFPFQENANVMFNSALVYELAMLKPLAEPLLLQVEPGSIEYAEARRLLAFLQWFLPGDAELIPDNSLLREFIGGSILHNFPFKYDIETAC